jgi:hypothetical protein
MTRFSGESFGILSENHQVGKSFYVLRQRSGNRQKRPLTQQKQLLRDDRSLPEALPQLELKSQSGREPSKSETNAKAFIVDEVEIQI